jgi:hypothetical protein
MPHVKIAVWSKTHRDTYVYSDSHHAWFKVDCDLAPGMDCTAPHSYPRGKCPGYNASRDVPDEAYENALPLRH